MSEEEEEEIVEVVKSEEVVGLEDDTDVDEEDEDEAEDEVEGLVELALVEEDEEEVLSPGFPVGRGNGRDIGKPVGIGNLGNCLPWMIFMAGASIKVASISTRRYLVQKNVGDEMRVSVVNWNGMWLGEGGGVKNLQMGGTIQRMEKSRGAE
jgi:hypothetical protein